jgi:PAS domain S-box-containing protein
VEVGSSRSTIRSLDLPGRTLSLQLRSTPAFEATVHRELPWLVFGIGSLASLGLATLLLVGSRKRRHLRGEIDRLGLVARLTSNAVIVTDRNGLVTWTNPAFEHITGFTGAEVLGRSPGMLLQCEATDQSEVARLRAALRAGQGFVGELLNRGKTGRTYWLALDIQPVLDACGKLGGFVAVESDITDRKQAESQLRASQRFLSNTARIAGVGGWDLDLQTGAIQWSAQACLIFDHPTDDRPSLRASIEHFAPALWPRLWEIIERRDFGPDVLDRELPATTATGRSIWIHLVAEPVLVDGLPVRLSGVVKDVTEQRALATKASHHMQLLRSAIDALDEAFVIFDPDERLVYCNNRCLSLNAESPELLVPGTCYEDILRGSAESGRFPAAEGRIEAWVDERLAAFRAGDRSLIEQIGEGRILRVVDRKTADGYTVGFRLDITELVHATEQARRENRSKSDFIATMSHELRTPLQVITGFSDLGKTFAAGQVPFEGMFADIHANGMRMLGLVNDLLDIAKIEGPAGHLALQDCDLAQLTAEVMRELGTLAAARGVRLDWLAAPPQLPVTAEPRRLQQVLRNVLANAIRFAPAGSTVEIDGRKFAATQARIRVRDHGPGIPDDELESVFEPFMQSSRTRDGSGGTGLGLTISRKIMSAFGGSIAAANAHGGGAVMTISLPLETEFRTPSNSRYPAQTLLATTE